MIRHVDGSFRGFNWVGMVPQKEKANCVDWHYSPSPPPALTGHAQRTAGATILENVPALFPPTAEDCHILSFSVSATLRHMVDNAGAGRPIVSYGKFGKIVAGLTAAGNQTSSTDGGFNGIPWQTPFLPLPSDMSLVGDLWNPAVDDLPPQNNYLSIVGGAAGANLPIRLSQTLPEPLPVPRSAPQLLIGIWMLPSILSGTPEAGTVDPTVWVYIMDATYTLYYDDEQ